MKATVYILLLILSLTIAVAFFINGKVVSTLAPTAKLPESPWVLETKKNSLGSEIFASCASCHMADGSGRSDGEIPRLAGQRESVLIHKLQKLRDGSTYLPVMVPFARSLSLEELTKVSGYIANLPSINTTKENESNISNLAPLNYEKYCSACHGEEGQGNDSLLAPKLCGQFSPYLIRRMKEIEQNTRGDADSAMRSILVTISLDDQAELAEWLETQQCTVLQASTGTNNDS
jgi:cytochrome c553